MYKKMWGVLLIVITLQACAGLNPISAVTDLLNPNKPSIAVETEIVAGDKEEAVNTQIGTTSNSTQAAEVINNKTINETDPFLLIMLVLGWILPSPMEIWKGLTGVLRRNKNG